MFRQFFLQMMIIISFQIKSSASSLSFVQTKPDCQSKCGDVSIPYPFGIITSSSSSGRDCSIDGSLGIYGFSITCNTTYDPPKPFLEDGTGEDEYISLLMGLTSRDNQKVEILSISESEIRLKTWQTATCYTESGALLTPSMAQSVLFVFTGSPFTFSNTKNRVFAVGCDLAAHILLMDRDPKIKYESQCQSECVTRESVFDQEGACTGNGCCEMTFPKGMAGFLGMDLSHKNHTEVWSFNPCSSIFMAEKAHFKFNAEKDILPRRKNNSLVYKEGNKDLPLPVVLNWAIGNKTCEEAQKNVATFACHQDYNSHCINSDNGPGYRCSCNEGYAGNPYIAPGCQDVNECEDLTNNPCEATCVNTIGSYSCVCPKGTAGDGRKEGHGCIIRTQKEPPTVKVVIGVGTALLSWTVIASLLFLCIKKRKLSKIKAKFFKQNGGLVLKQKLGLQENSVESRQIFTAKELELATKNYDKTQILGSGGYGTVYKGALSDNRVVAIKKSQVAVKSQIEQFINEVVILTQVHHRNVVKLLGCCLETEVPLLVYEYVSNGTLFEHIHQKGVGLSSISWEARLRIAAETAGALAYLHSAAAIPVIHRDIKSTNILLDENFTAKVSDFGASRLIPLDRTQITTNVQGTIGYLDPEYHQTSQLTDKSDVYSFGVVLVELLTGKEPIYVDEISGQHKNLTAYFISSLKDGGMFDLLDARVTKEGKQEQIVIAAELAKRCLNFKGEERPKMKEVAAELESIKRMLETNTSDQECPPNYKEEEADAAIESQDLYPVPFKC